MDKDEYIIEKGLYVVGTPIGNLGDITKRALDVFNKVDFVVCEDTRETGKLLSHFSISKPMIVFNARSKDKIIQKILDIIINDGKVALVTDAGTPAISDPGSLLVDRIRKFFEEKKEDSPIFSIPGPSAVISALSISGFPSSEFVFYGFLPNKKGRNKIFEEILLSNKTSVFYESPHRIIKTLFTLKEKMPDRSIFIGRELTKIFEEGWRGKAKDGFEYFEKNKDKIRGEFTLIISSK